MGRLVLWGLAIYGGASLVGKIAKATGVSASLSGIAARGGVTPGRLKYILTERRVTDDADWLRKPKLNEHPSIIHSIW